MPAKALVCLNASINVPVLGLVENMAWFTPAELPNNNYYIFGKDGGKKISRRSGVPLGANSIGAGRCAMVAMQVCR
ncbi:MAG: P-loop NTPase [Bacteroidetes bacterium]|nr:P-loop NTPase [Bacteroidota bacterium]